MVPDGVVVVFFTDFNILLVLAGTYLISPPEYK